MKSINSHFYSKYCLYRVLLNTVHGNMQPESDMRKLDGIKNVNRFGYIRLILSAYCNDFWKLNILSRQWEIMAVGPSARSSHCLVSDPGRNQAQSHF